MSFYAYMNTQFDFPAKSSLWMAVLAIEDENADERRFLSRVRPFDASVFSFNHVRPATHCLGELLVPLLWCNCYDDFPQLELASGYFPRKSRSAERRMPPLMQWAQLLTSGGLIQARASLLGGTLFYETHTFPIKFRNTSGYLIDMALKEELVHFVREDCPRRLCAGMREERAIFIDASLEGEVHEQVAAIAALELYTSVKALEVLAESDSVFL